MHSDILQTAIREFHVHSYRLSAATPRVPHRSVYLYGIHLVFVSANAVDEVLLPQAMALHSLSQLFLYSNMQTNKDRNNST